MVLLTVLRKQHLRERGVRVLLLGLDNAGKTTIVRALLGEDTHTVSPTVGFVIHSVRRRGYTLNVWDVGGQRSLRPFWHNYFEKTDCLVWVIDAAAPERLDTCADELRRALAEGAGSASLLVLVNKLDLVPDRAAAVATVTAKLRLHELPAARSVRVLGCSAYEGANLEEALDWIVGAASRRYAVAPSNDFETPHAADATAASAAGEGALRR